MELIFEIRGHCCDLALHPVSDATAERMRHEGAAIYKEKYMNWWRSGKTATCGMRIDADMIVNVTLDGEPVDFSTSLMTKEFAELRRRMYLDSKANYLSVLGYDNELCGCVWKWKNIQAYDPAKLSFLTQKWDRIMGEPDFYIVDNVLYDGEFADAHQWCDSKGFDLITPIVIDLRALRSELALSA